MVGRITFPIAKRGRWPSTALTLLGDDIPEQRGVITTVATLDRCIVSNLLNKSSSLNRACRIIAYCLRFVKARRPSVPTKFVSPVEISFALSIMCKAAQRQAFASEYKALSKGDVINAASAVLLLSPFMDKAGLIRVGGRLKNSRLQFDTCHPILLPRNHDLTHRVIEYEHIRNLHAGTQATMAS